MTDFIWMAGGPQGSGVDSSANIFARACCYGGLHVYGKREYSSNIKGLHSYFHIRVSPHEVGAIVNRVDLLCTFDAESVVRHIWDCLLYTSDAADDLLCVDLGGRRIIKKKNDR